MLRNHHAQTVLASQVLRPPAVPVVRERLELDDGDFVDLAHGLPNGAREARTSSPAPPLVVLFHGLSGSIESSYARGAMAALDARGFATCLMHWRGCSGEPNRLARSYHSGASDDIGRLVETLHERHPTRPLYALGYSLGANALLKYLGERGESTPLTAALAVGPPLVLAVGAARLDRGGLSSLYRRHLLGRLRAQHEAKRARYPALELPPAHRALDTFRAFDDALTAPLHGFAGVDDYYTRCSARRYLGRIRRPTHILCARDDPFFTEEILPEASELAPGTTLELARHGGHIGFVAAAEGGTSARFGTARWLDTHVATTLLGLHRGGAASDMRWTAAGLAGGDSESEASDTDRRRGAVGGKAF